MTAAQLEKVLQNWRQAKGKENEWLASCPLTENHNHGDADPSLVITEKGEKGSEVLVHCRICDDKKLWSALCAKIAEPVSLPTSGT